MAADKEVVASQPGDGVSFYLSRGEPKEALKIIGISGAILLAFLFWPTWVSNDGSFWVMLILVPLSLSPIAAIFLVALIRAKGDRNAHLTIGPEGIFAPKLTAEPVPWDAIQSIATQDAYYKNSGARMNVLLILHLNDSSRFGHRGSYLVRRFNRWWYGSELVMGLAHLGGAPEDVLTAVKRFAPGEVLARSVI